MNPEKDITHPYLYHILRKITKYKKEKILFVYLQIVLRYTLYLIEKTRDNYPSGNLSISEFINEKRKVLMKCFKSCQHEMEKAIFMFSYA